jgi:hypothetical protein
MEHEYGMLAAAGALDSAPTDILASPSFDWNAYYIPGDCEHRRLLKQAVATLPRSAIGDMQRRELVFAIRTAELPWLDAAEARLEYTDRSILERLAYLARRVCGRQLNGSGEPHAWNGGLAAADANGRRRPFREQFDHDPPPPPAEEPQWREKAR